MTASVTSLASRRNPEPACQCPRHQLEALVERVGNQLDTRASELLIPREVLAEMVADVAETVGRAIAANDAGPPNPPG